MRDGGCVEFLQWALPRLRMRWPGFRKVRGQVCKRLARRLGELELDDLEAYRAHLAAQPQEWLRLDAMCRITISRFCRDRGVFAALERHVLPALAAGCGGELRAWSAGCGAGEEPYTLSILWRQSLATRFPAVTLRIVATDADEPQLTRARRAHYPQGTLRELPHAWIDAAFERRGDAYALRPPYRAGIDFRLQDLRRTHPPEVFQLALCRYLAFTYFAPPLQRETAETFATHLQPGGYLVLGNHEVLPASTAFEPTPYAHVYRRR